MYVCMYVCMYQIVWFDVLIRSCIMLFIYVQP